MQSSPPIERIESDGQHAFSIEHLRANLRSRSLSGGAITVGAQLVKVPLQIFSTVLLARLLAPEDFGMFSMAMAVTTFATIFGDLGLPLAAVQRDEINQNQISALFWLSMVQSLLLTAVVVITGPLIALAFHEPRLPVLLTMMSATYVLLATGSLHQALLKRQMRFVPAALIELIAVSTGIITAIVLACYGQKVLALIYMQLVTTAISTLGLWVVCRWRPNFPSSSAGLLPLLQFGRNITVFNFLNYVIRNLDNLLVGRFCGASVLGLYDRAYQLHMLPAQLICWPTTGVGVSTLSAVQREPARFNKYAQTMMLLLTGVCMPIIAFFCVRAESIIVFALGARWMSAVLIFKILAPAAFFDSALIVVGWAAMSSGQTGRLTSCRFVQALVTTVAFLIGIKWGAIGIAAAHCGVRLLAPLPSLIFCAKGTELKAMSLARAALPPALSSIAAAAGICFVGMVFQAHVNRGVALLFDGSLFCVLYALALSCFPSAQAVALRILEITKSSCMRLPPLRQSILSRAATEHEAGRLPRA